MVSKGLNLFDIQHKGFEMSEFDYVIIGAGSAGCVLANRLTEDPNVSVCLLEAGKTHQHWSVRIPAMSLVNMVLKTRNWGYETVPQKGLNGRRGYQPRGKMLGGSSGSNAMIYIRGHKSDYDAWAALGNKGWSYKDVLPYFKKSQHREAGANDHHGQDGELNVAAVTSAGAVNDIFLDACSQLQLPKNDDFNGAKQEGVGLHEVTQKNGERWSTARAFLEPAMERPNLTVITGAHTEKILIENKRATAVQYRVKKTSHTVKARREVILSAGAFGSPQTLLLSGIGAEDKLAPHGITQTHDLKGVGENLQDHIDHILSFDANMKDNIGFSVMGAFRMIGEMLRYRRERKGMLTTNYAESGGFLYLDREEPAPDIQLHMVRAVVDDHGRKLHWGHGYSCHVCVLRPKSRGRVTLNSADPFDAPAIDPAFLEDKRDMEKLVKGAKLTQEIMRAPAFDAVRGKPFYDSNTDDDAKLRADIRARADTVYHPVGTCKMGHDEMAVVDNRLRVHGLDGLRVIDASIMPNLISGNTNAPTIMIAEKGADMIKEDAAANISLAAE